MNPTKRPSFPNPFVRYFGQSLLVSFLLAASMVASAQPDRPNAADLFPERTSFFVHVQDTRELFEDLKESNFGRMLSDERLAPFIQKAYGTVADAYEEVEDDMGVSLSDLQSLPQGEFTFAVLTPRRETPSYAIMMDVDPDSDIAERLIARGVQEAEDNGDGIDSGDEGDFEFDVIRTNDDDIYYILRDGTFLACNDEDSFREMLLRWQEQPPERDKVLSQNRKFITTMNKCKSTEDLPMAGSFFLDPLMLARSISVDQPGARLFFGALPILGLDGLNAIGGSVLFNEKGYEYVFHTHVLLANPRAGILEMVAMKPGKYEPESFVPEDTVTYATLSWDFPKFMSELENIVDTFTGDGTFQRQIDENINDELGINFQEDVMANLAGRVTYLQWISDPPTLDGQCNALVVEVRDEEAATGFIESVMDSLFEDTSDDDFPFFEDDYKGVTIWSSKESMENQQRRARRRWRARRENVDEEDLEDDNDGTQLELLETTPSFCFIDGHFILAGNPTFLEHLVDTHEGDNDTLNDDETFKETMEEMQTLMDGNLPSALMYTRPDKTLQMFYEVLQSDNTRDVIYERGENSQFFDSLSTLLEENELPPFEDLAQYFPPQGTFVINDETGWHLLTFQRKSEESEEDDD